MPAVEEDALVEERFTIRIPPPLMVRIERLIDRPELGFTSLQHFVAAGIHSFVSYKEREVARLRGDTKW